MGFLERLNQILVGILMILVAMQACLLFFMKSMENDAHFRLVQNTTKANVACSASPFADDMYWDVSSDIASGSVCESCDCPYSHLSWSRSGQDRELHVISVQQPPPFRLGKLDQGGSILVNVKPSEKPIVLSLVSRRRLEWNIKVAEGAQIAKVIVATPEVVWIKGLPATTEIEYLPKDKMCSYPFSWEEAYNPDNEFRVLAKTLETISGLKMDTFQGAVIGNEFRVPVFEQQRQLASVDEKALPPAVTDLRWAREQGKVRPRSIKVKNQTDEIAFPEKTDHALKTPDQAVFIVKDYRLYRWNITTQEFEPQRTPMYLPEVDEVTGIAYNDHDRALYVYNDERGGELYRYGVEDSKWTLIQRGFPFDFQAIYFDSEQDALFAVVARGNYMTQLVRMDKQGKVVKVSDLKNKVAFDKKRWRWQLSSAAKSLELQVHSAAEPQGRRIALDPQ